MVDASINLGQPDVFAVEAVSAEFEGPPFAWLCGLADAWPLRLSEGWSQDVQNIRRGMYTSEVEGAAAECEVAQYGE